MLALLGLRLAMMTTYFLSGLKDEVQIAACLMSALMPVRGGSRIECGGARGLEVAHPEIATQTNARQPWHIALGCEGLRPANAHRFAQKRWGWLGGDATATKCGARQKKLVVEPPDGHHSNAN